MDLVLRCTVCLQEKQRGAFGSDGHLRMSARELSAHKSHAAQASTAQVQGPPSDHGES